MIKKILGMLFVLLLVITLVSCKGEKEENIDPNPPVETEDDNNDNKEEETEKDDDKEKETEDDNDDEYINVVDESKTYTLDSELRTKDVSTIQKYKLNGHKSFKLKLFMGGNYDNPMTIKNIVIDGVKLDLNVSGLPTKAGEHESGDFKIDDYSVTFHRATNYQPLRIKSSPEDSGYMILDVTDVKTLEIELVFTTGAADYFDKVELTFE